MPLTLPPWLALLGADLRRLSCPAPSREFPARRDSVPCYGLQGNQAQEYRNPTLFRPDCHGDGPRSREFPVSSLLIRESARETGSLATGSTANQSAVAETLHPLPAAVPETPALSRGLGRGAQPNRHRRRRVLGRWRAAGSVCLCCQVWRSRFASAKAEEAAENEARRPCPTPGGAPDYRSEGFRPTICIWVEVRCWARTIGSPRGIPCAECAGQGNDEHASAEAIERIDRTL